VSLSRAVIEGSYDYGVVVLSTVIAVLSSLAALEFANRFATSPLRPRRFWLLGWALSQGGGIWSMHYTGMLAFRLPLPTKYDWPTALLSFVIAMAGATCMILVVRRHHLSAVRLAIDLQAPSDRVPHHTLSNREFEVMRLVTEGKSNAEIADLLAISDKTVSTYRARILDKLHLRTTADVIRYALEHHIVN